MEDAGVDAAFDDIRGDLDNIENAEIGEILFRESWWDAEFTGGSGVEFLENLGGDDAAALLGMGGDEGNCGFLFGGIRAVDASPPNPICTS